MSCARYNFSILDGSSKLTSAALLRHDASQGIGRLTAADLELGSEAGKNASAEEMEATAMTHKTFDTFASDWSGCTNVAFEKVMQKFKANNAGHKVGESNACVMIIENLTTRTCSLFWLLSLRLLRLREERKRRQNILLL